MHRGQLDQPAHAQLVGTSARVQTHQAAQPAHAGQGGALRLAGAERGGGGVAHGVEQCAGEPVTGGGHPGRQRLGCRRRGADGLGGCSQLGPGAVAVEGGLHVGQGDLLVLFEHADRQAQQCLEQWGAGGPQFGGEVEPAVGHGGHETQQRLMRQRQHVGHAAVVLFGRQHGVDAAPSGDRAGEPACCHAAHFRGAHGLAVERTGAGVEQRVQCDGRAVGHGGEHVHGPGETDADQHDRRITRHQGVQFGQYAGSGPVGHSDADHEALVGQVGGHVGQGAGGHRGAPVGGSGAGEQGGRLGGVDEHHLLPGQAGEQVVGQPPAHACGGAHHDQPTRLGVGRGGRSHRHSLGIRRWSSPDERLGHRRAHDRPFRAVRRGARSRVRPPGRRGGGER